MTRPRRDPGREERAQALARAQRDVRHGRADEVADFALEFVAEHSTDAAAQELAAEAFRRQEEG